MKLLRLSGFLGIIVLIFIPVDDWGVFYRFRFLCEDRYGSTCLLRLRAHDIIRVPNGIAPVLLVWMTVNVEHLLISVLKRGLLRHLSFSVEQLRILMLKRRDHVAQNGRID